MTESLDSFQNTFKKDILLFKNDILKDVKVIEYKLNSKFETNSLSTENTLNEYKNKIDILTQKVYDLSSLIMVDKNMKEKIDSLIKFKDNIKDELMNQKVKIESNYKELHDSLYSHDKLLAESIIYPGVIGGMGRFKNLHEFIDYVLTNIKEIINYKEKNTLDLKSYKVKLDTTMKNIKLQMDGLTKSINDYTKKCINQTENKLIDMINISEDRIQDIRLENYKYAIDLKNNCDNLNNEMEKIAKIKDEIYEKINLDIENMKQANYGVTIKFEGYKKEFNQIKSKFSQFNDLIKEINSKINSLKEKKTEISLNYKNKNNENNNNNNDNNDNNKPKNKTVSIKKQEILNTPKNGKKVESFVKKYINGEVGLNEFIHRNSNKENNENKLFNINEIEDYSNFNSNENNSLMRLTYNNSFNNFLNQKNYRNNINSFFFLNNQNSNSGNYEYDNNNEINELNKNKFYQRIKQLNFQNKSFSEIPMKNHKVSSDKILESKYIKIKKYNEVDSENINEEEPKKINLIKHKMNNSLNSEDIKNFASRSYSVFPKLPKRKSLNNVFKMPRSYSEEEDKNRIGLPYNNPNLSNYTFQSPNINLKKIEVNNLNADMFKSIDGDNSYFNKNNSSVSFIGNSIQVIHSKKNKKIKIENKNDESKYDEKNKKKKDFLNLSNRLNEGKEIGKYVNQIKDNITHFIVENKEEDDFLNRKIVEKKNYKKIKETSQEKINSYYNIIGNDNSETKYSKLSKILNNIPPKNIPKTNLLLNDKYNSYKEEEK